MQDFRSPNLLLLEDWTVKVADFNLVKILDGAETGGSATDGVTNPRWLAPEVLGGGPHTFASVRLGSKPTALS